MSLIEKAAQRLDMLKQAAGEQPTVPEPVALALEPAESSRTQVVEAESQLENARQKHLEVVSHLKDLLEKRRKAATAVDDARAKLEKHLNIIRKTHVTLRGGCHE